MQTLIDYQKLDTDLIVKGVYDWLFEEDSGILQKVPQKQVQGNGVKYNVETAYPGGAWTQPGDTIPEDTGTYTQRSAAVYEFIGDADVDKFVMATNSTQNPEAVEMERKIRGMVWNLHEAMIFGQTTTSSTTNQPKGLMLLLSELESESTTDLDAGNNTQVVAGTATSGALTQAKIEETLDACKMGANALIMSRLARRKINALARASGTPMRVEQIGWGRFITVFNDVPIYINDHIPDNLPDGVSSVLTISTYAISTTRASGADNSIIFAAKLADNGFTMIHPPAFGGLKHENLGTVQNKDAIRHRFKWYCGFACFNKFSLAGCINFNPDD